MDLFSRFIRDLLRSRGVLVVGPHPAVIICPIAGWATVGAVIAYLIWRKKREAKMRMWPLPEPLEDPDHPVRRGPG